MNDGAGICIIVGLIFLAVGLGFIFESIAATASIFGGGLIAIGLFDAMLTYLNKSSGG